MLLFLLKLVESKEEAHDILSGKLVIPRLSDLKNEDPGEGAILLQPTELDHVLLRRKDTEVKIDPSDLAGAIRIQMDWMSHLNVYSMYAGHTGGFEYISSANKKEFEDHIKLPDQVLQKNKRYAVVTNNVTRFVERIENAVKSNSYFMLRGLVKYYGVASCPDSKQVDGLEWLLWKKEDFSYQREYRFIIGTGTIGKEPITLEIGDIRDCAFVMDSAEINDTIKIKLPEEVESDRKGGAKFLPKRSPA